MTSWLRLVWRKAGRETGSERGRKQIASGPLAAGFSGRRAWLEEKIRDHHDNGVAAGQAVQNIERFAKTGPAPGGLKEQDFADHAQDVAASFFGRDIFLDLLGEKNQAHLVVVADGGEGQHGGDLGRQFAFGLRARTEDARSAQVHQEHEGQLPFLHIFFNERMVHARRDVPINGADFVAGLVFAHLLKIHALPLENAVVLAAQGLGDQTGGAQLDLADFFKDFARDHGKLRISAVAKAMADKADCGLRIGRAKNSACAGELVR